MRLVRNAGFWNLFDSYGILLCRGTYQDIANFIYGKD